MKVTVCFDVTKVVVPCGNGSNSIQHLITEAFSRYKKVIPKGRDISHLDINGMKLNLKDGGILDPDDKISDVLEDKEQIFVTFNENEILDNSKDLISSILDLKAKVQGHSSPISESPKNEVFEESVHEDIYCVITAEDLKSDSHLRVRQTIEVPNNLKNDFKAFLDENLNQVSKGKTKSKLLQSKNVSERPNVVGDAGISDSDKSVSMITLKNDSPILGIHVMPEYNNKEDLTGLRVRSIEKDGLADKDGRLKCGDVIVEINDVSLYKVDFAEAQEIFKCARDDPELHLKVIHKAGNVSNEDIKKKKHHNQSIEDELECYQDEQLRHIQERKEYASMVNLSPDTNEQKETHLSNTLKSVSMNDLMTDIDFYHDKVFSNFSEDECEDAEPGARTGNEDRKSLAKLKEMFANDQRFNRRRANDSLNRAVDKSIDPDSKEKKQGIFKSVEPNPVKKRHWWSRLKLSKKNKDDSKKTKKEQINKEFSSPSKTDKQLQSKPKNIGNISNNTKVNVNGNNNNNNNVTHQHPDSNQKTDKGSIEWMHRVSWLGSRSESLTSQSNSQNSKTFDLKESDVKTRNNRKVVNVAENEFENVTGNKNRSRSAVQMERKVISGGPNRVETQVPVKSDSQTHSRSFNDLSKKEGRNGPFQDGPSGGRMNVGVRAISHYHVDDNKPHKQSFIPPDNRFPPYNDSKPDSKRSDHSNFEMPGGSSRSRTAQEKLFGKTSDDRANKRLPVILKELSSHNNHEEGFIRHSGPFNSQVYKPTPMPRVTWNPVCTTPQHHYHQSHFQNATAVPNHFEQSSNLVSTSQERYHVNVPIQNIAMEYPSAYGPSVNGQFQNSPLKFHHQRPQGRASPRSIRPPPPVSDHFLPRGDFSNDGWKENDRFGPHYDDDGIGRRHFNDNPRPGFYHFQQNSDITEYGNAFWRVAPGQRRDPYDVRRQEAR